MNEAVMIFVWTAGSHTAKAESQAGGSRTCVRNGRKVEPHGRRTHVAHWRCCRCGGNAAPSMK